MRCPYCHVDDDKVVDSRPADDGDAVRRRRECLGCGRRFTTYERVDALPLVVAKRSGARSRSIRRRCAAGIERAIVGRGIDSEVVDGITAEVEDRARAQGPEVTSELVGLAVLERLRVIDPVSYVRFASVYKGFEALSDFEREVGELQKTTAPKGRKQPLQ